MLLMATTNQNQHLDLGSDTSSVWNFYTSSILRCHCTGKPVVALANVSCSLSGEKDSLAYNYKNNRLHFQSHGIKGSCVNTTGVLPKDFPNF